MYHDKVGFIPEMQNLANFGKSNQCNSQQTEKEKSCHGLNTCKK